MIFPSTLPRWDWPLANDRIGARRRGGSWHIATGFGGEEGAGMSGFFHVQWGKRRRLLRRATAVGFLGIVALLLSACVEVNQQSTIKQDFTGTTQIRLGISKQLLAFA